MPSVDGDGKTALYDLMSYCGDTADTSASDGDHWISPFNWDRISRRFVEVGQRVQRYQTVFPRTADLPRRADTGQLAFAIGTVTASGGRIARILPFSPPAPAADVAASPLRLRSLAADGHVIAEVGVRIVPSAVDRGGVPGGGTFTVGVPAHAAALELVRDGVILDRLRPAPLPAVRLLNPLAGAHVRGGRDLVVRWSSSAVDRGRGRPEASVDYSSDNGRTWRTVVLAPSTGRAVIPGGFLQGTRRARIRVGVNDGLGESRALSAPFRVDGHPPVASIVVPTRRQQLRADTPTALLGVAFDDAGVRLRGRSLSWFAGKRLLGSGERLLARLPWGRYSLVLVARDRSGRTGETRLAVRVARVPLRLLELRFSANVRRGARELLVRLRASVPASLHVGRKRYRVDARLRTVRPPLARKPLAGILRIPLVLVADRAAAGRLHGFIEVRRA
ncbi:MAG: hypothetical protein M3Z27_04170 [Actinomycetota bacterium]|nr:hypothetical protein [Actinomycetota bacterium]